MDFNLFRIYITNVTCVDIRAARKHFFLFYFILFIYLFIYLFFGGGGGGGVGGLRHCYAQIHLLIHKGELESLTY